MTLRKIAGGIMLAVPFVAGFVFAAHTIGLWRAVAVYAVTFTIIIWIFAGVALLNPGSRIR